VLSKARHSKSQNVNHYIVQEKHRKGHFWYVADSPFSFTHFEDRYFIFCDILWDILEEEPESSERVALLRIEDVRPGNELESLKWATEFLAMEKVPYTFALIPYYTNLMPQEESGGHLIFDPITKYREFSAFLKYAKERGGKFVWHGVSHHAGEFISGYAGVSGADYEFWTYPENRPHPKDSVDWVLDRLELGKKVLDELGIVPEIWEVPHYAASVLDYKLFAKLFEWNYHRSIYFPHEMISDTYLPKKYLMVNCNDDECRKERRSYLRNIKAKVDYTTFGGQIMPYPIWKDSYGQSIIPVTLGMINFAFYSKNTWRPVSTPQDIIRRAKKLKVIRGAYASFYWHPDLLDKNNRYFQEHPGSYEKMGGKQSLQMVIRELKNLGYVFKSVYDCKLFPRSTCSNQGENK